MSAVWYEVFGRINPTIKPVSVERHTQTSVWVRGRRHAQRAEWGGYFPTWEDAHAHALRQAEAEVMSARRALERASSALGNVKGMKRPEPQP